MIKMSIGKILTALLILMVGAGAVYSYGFYSQDQKTRTQMQNILENGTFEQFKELKEESSYPMAKWIDSEEKFNEMQQRHQSMIENGYEPGARTGMGKKHQHQSLSGNCPHQN